jgi:hypothetical protein
VQHWRGRFRFRREATSQLSPMGLRLTEQLDMILRQCPGLVDTAFA